MLSEIAGWLAAKSPPADREVVGYSIDSRTVREGELFCAIRGSGRDGHDYVRTAFDSGACAAIVRSGWATENEGVGPVLAVKEPLEALGSAARQARRQWGRPLAAVTGSNGKTTTKDLIAAMLETKYRVAKSAGNLNNELGLPLSLLRFDGEADVGVAEMGMNHAGEIRRLARVAEPTVGVVTNVNAVHLEHFSSVDEIASAKRELIEELPSEGTAVLNSDDPRVARFRHGFAGRTVTFGINMDANFKAVDIETLGAAGVRFRLDAGGERFESSLPGRHNVSNILAALATASVFGVGAEDARAAVLGFQPRGMRGEVLTLGSVTVLNDCYNSNPKALAEMLTVLRETPAKRRVAVLGEMQELGTDSAAFHYEAGRQVAEARVDVLGAVGRYANEMMAGAVENGLSGDSAFSFEEAGPAGTFLARTVSEGDAVLLKGSRGVGLERALGMLRQSLEEAEGEQI